MLTAADIEGRLLVPLTELFGRDPAPVDPEAVDGSVGDLLDRVLCADSSLQAVENGLRGRVVVVLDTEIALKPFGDTSDFVQNFVMGKKKRGATFGQLINKKAQEFDWDALVEIGDLLNCRVAGRADAEEITHHLNNNGCGMQFAAAGARILANARRMGLGTELAGDFFLQKEHT